MGFAGDLVSPAEEKSGVKLLGKKKDWVGCIA